MKKNSGLRKLFAIGSLALMLLALPGAQLWAEEIKAPAANKEPAAATQEPEEKPTADFTVTAMSQYFWRGYELSRNSVVIQPSMTISYKGFAVNLWGNLDTKPYSPGNVFYTGTWNETDLTLSYTKTLGLFTVGGGYIYYGLAPLNKDAADRDDSQELFAAVSLNTLLTPTLTVYKEIDHYRNWYVLLGISHLFELNKMASLKLAATAGYLLSTDAEKYPKFDKNALATTDKFSNFHDGTVSASLPLKATDRITITPTLSYIFPLTGDAKDEMKGLGLKGAALPSQRDSSFLSGGLAASFTF